MPDADVYVCVQGGMEAMANTIPGAATGSKATPLMRAFIREMLMAQGECIPWLSMFWLSALLSSLLSSSLQCAFHTL